MNKARITKLKDQVEYCLQYHPSTRNSDIDLTICVWIQFYEVRDSIELGMLYTLPSQDNIKRIRATFNQKGKYFPTNEEVARKRQINMTVWHDWLRVHRAHDRFVESMINEVPANEWGKATPGYKCEYETEAGLKCPRDAVIEWKFAEADEDGIEIYYSYRCAMHPEESPEYRGEPL